MSAAKRLTACLIVMATCLAVLLAVRDWPRTRSSSDRGVVLPRGHEVQILERRSAARVSVVEQLFEGELTLPQAAVRFRQLNEYPPEFRVSLCQWPGDSDGERLCRQVIFWARNHLHGKGQKPDEVEAAVEPLECELQRLLGENGEIELPPVDEGGGEPEKR